MLPVLFVLGKSSPVTERSSKAYASVDESAITAKVPLSFAKQEETLGGHGRDNRDFRLD